MRRVAERHRDDPLAGRRRRDLRLDPLQHVVDRPGRP
jgi:hypothetical protein